MLQQSGGTLTRQSRAVAAAALLVAAVAAAEPPSIRNGVKLGQAWAHPFLSVTSGYDSLTVRSFSAFDAPLPAGDVVLRPSLGADLHLDNADTRVNAAAILSYVLFTGLVTPGARQLTYFEALLGVDAAFNRSGAVEVQLGDRLSHSPHTSNTAATTALLSLHNSAWAALLIHPGAGSIQVSPRVQWDVEAFSPLVRPDFGFGSGIGNNDVSLMNYTNLNSGLAVKWKFLPELAAVVDATLDYRAYFAATRNRPASLLKLNAGVVGLLTPRLWALFLIGAGGDFIGGSRTLLVRAELAWIGDSVTARGGYVRSLNPVPVYGIAGLDRGYAGLDATISGQIAMRGYVTVDYLTNYASSDRWASYPPPPSQEVVATGQLALTWQAVRFFAVGLSYQLSCRSSSSPRPFPGTNFCRHEPMLTLALSAGDAPEQLPRRDPTVLQPPLEVDAPRFPGVLPSL